MNEPMIRTPAAVGMLLLLIGAWTAAAEGDYGGPCKGGYWPDGEGCCPLIIDGMPHYRDTDNQCYPRAYAGWVAYADSQGCYPDDDGDYLPVGEECPEDRQCKKRCIAPDDDGGSYKTTTTTMKYPVTIPQETTTTTTTTTTTQKYTQKPDDNPWDGKCGADLWADKDRCCPRAVGTHFFYRDHHGCYPIHTRKGVLFADGSGCYPNKDGEYLKAGEHCPEARQCMPACDGEPPKPRPCRSL